MDRWVLAAYTTHPVLHSDFDVTAAGWQWYPVLPINGHQIGYFMARLSIMALFMPTPLLLWQLLAAATRLSRDTGPLTRVERQLQSMSIYGEHQCLAARQQIPLLSRRIRNTITAIEI